MQSSILNDFKRDRLFGKDVTNVLPQKNGRKEPRLSYVSRKDIVRGISEDQPKKNISGVLRANRQAEPMTNRNNVSMKEVRETKDTVKEQTISHDPQLVPDYFEENLRFMSQQELRKQPLCCSLQHQKDLNEGMRMILLDWLVDVHLKLRMFPQTLFITCHLIDRYLAKRDVGRSRLQLLGATCLFVAAKYEETYEVPQLQDLVSLCAKAFTKEDFQEMEATILKALDFDLIVDSMFKFLEPFARLQNLDSRGLSFCRMTLQLSLYDMKMNKYRPSMMAASAIYLNNKLRKRQQIWGDHMIAATGYEESELKHCSKDLMDLLQGLSSNNYAKNLRRKFSMSGFYEVAKNRYERKDFD